MAQRFVRGVIVLVSVALAAPSPNAFAQVQVPPPPTEASATEFNVQQLDAILAPIALFPDELLTQILMASTYPLQVVAVARWLGEGNNKNLTGDALAKALEAEDWDPSVKSLVPFPQVIAMMNDNLDWLQQLGYAVAVQQAAVLDSIQRLRQQAQSAGNLQSNQQQSVVTQDNAIIIAPVNQETVYVPVYNPSVVFGTWPYPNYPPVYFPPYPAYPIAYGVATGLAFAAGVAVIGGLWGWARPAWRYGNISINTARFNNINVNRPPLGSGTWRPPAGGVGGRPIRPPGGPVGAPARPRPLPANAIGRANVQVPAGAINRPQIQAGDRNLGRAGAGAGGAQRPAGAGQGLGGQRAGGGQGLGGQRPNVTQRPNVAQRPAQLPAGGGQARGAGQFSSADRAGAFGGVRDGNRAGQFSARGAQSRSIQQTGFQGRPASGGGVRGGGGGGGRGGGGRR
jgi:hypothetical protein